MYRLRRLRLTKVIRMLQLQNQVNESILSYFLLIFPRFALLHSGNVQFVFRYPRLFSVSHTLSCSKIPCFFFPLFFFFGYFLNYGFFKSFLNLIQLSNVFYRFQIRTRSSFFFLLSLSWYLFLIINGRRSWMLDLSSVVTWPVSNLPSNLILRMCDWILLLPKCFCRFDRYELGSAQDLTLQCDLWALYARLVGALPF